MAGFQPTHFWRLLPVAIWHRKGTMPKDIPVSNGNLLFNFDSDYQIRDVYFPLIGQENHSKGHPFRFGVWVDGNFSWMGPEWVKNLKYQDDSLVTEVFLKNESLRLELRCSDAVSLDSNVYIKKIEVTDLEGKDRQVKLFFTHDFHLYGNDIGDTSYFDPRTRSLIHYKANRYFLINCSGDGKSGVDYFACGIRGVEENHGTWKDAEEGELSGHPIAWGSADSTIEIRICVPPEGRARAFYWVAAGTQYHEVARLNQVVLEKTPEELIKETSDFWLAWVQKESRSFGDLPKTVTDIFNRSLLILRTQVDNRGDHRRKRLGYRPFWKGYLFLHVGPRWCFRGRCPGEGGLLERVQEIFRILLPGPVGGGIPFPAL